jgi:hypothetical protein
MLMCGTRAKIIVFVVNIRGEVDVGGSSFHLSDPKLSSLDAKTISGTPNFAQIVRNCATPPKSDDPALDIRTVARGAHVPVRPLVKMYP